MPLSRAGHDGNVLVLGDHVGSLLGVIRSLGRQGLKIHVAGCSPDSVALLSRYVAKAHHIPPYSPDNLDWLQAVLRLCRRESVSLVIPCGDPDVVPLQKHQAEFDGVCRPYTLPSRAFDVVFDKIATVDLARSLNVPLPNSVVVRSEQDIEAAAAAVGFPAVVKPPASYSLEEPTRKGEVAVSRDLRDFRHQVVSLLSRGPVLAQSFFAGVSGGIELLAKNGRILVAFQHLGVHEPFYGGASSYRVSVALNPGLLNAARRIVEALAYTGVAMIEYRIDPATGEWVLIEINGRFWGSLPLALAAGVDFPYYLYELLVFGRTDFPQQYRTGIYCRHVRKDIAWAVKNYRAKGDRGAPTLPWTTVAREILNVITLRERMDVLVLDDPKPGLVELLRMAGMLRLALQPRRSPALYQRR